MVQKAYRIAKVPELHRLVEGLEKYDGKYFVQRVTPLGGICNEHFRVYHVEEASVRTEAFYSDKKNKNRGSRIIITAKIPEAERKVKQVLCDLVTPPVELIPIKNISIK